MDCVIYEDTRQQLNKHELKHQWWREHGVEFAERAATLRCGDYMTPGCSTIVDTKQNILELCANVTREHQRVRKAYCMAVEKSWKLVILVENRNGVTDLDSLRSWVNDRCCKCLYMRGEQCNPYEKGKCRKSGKSKPVQGPQLAKICKTMQKRYGVRYMFCAPDESARVICELLGVGWND